MISLKKLKNFKTIEPKKSSNLKLSKSKSIKLRNEFITPKSDKKNKKVRFKTPIELKILTPNSISTKNKKFSNLNKTDKKPKFFPMKKIIIKSNENQNIDKKAKSRTKILSANISPKRESKTFVKYIKDYPKTFYQKIYNNIEKMKIKTDKEIKVMRKNLSLTNHEVFIGATKLINLNSLIRRGMELKRRSLIKKKNEEKLLNMENKQNKQNEDENSEENKTKKENLDIELETASDAKKSKSKEQTINISNSNKNYIKLTKLSLKPFYKIKSNKFYIPLFKSFDNEEKFYKNMYHIRFNDIRDFNTREVSKKIYDAPYILNILNSFIKQPDIQLKNILNKLKLLVNNIQIFYNNYLIKREFRHAFINMENQVKAQFNSIVEEECVLLIKLIPILLKEFYYSLPQLLFINIPQLNEEIEKQPSNEIECLKFNIDFFNKIQIYFSACVEIYSIIQKQIAEFKFSPNEFNILSNILDLARFNSTTLISMANGYIDKTKIDDDIFNNFQIGVNMKKKIESEKETDFERYHKRRRIKFLNDKEKIDRIKSALNIGNKEIDHGFIFNLNKKKNKINQTPSILDSFLIKDMMKYFTPEIKQQIISQRVIERFKKLEIERLKFNPENRRIDDGSGIINNEEENERQKEKKRLEKEKDIEENREKEMKKNNQKKEE